MRVWYCVILTIFTTQVIKGSNHNLWYSLQGSPDSTRGLSGEPAMVNGMFTGISGQESHIYDCRPPANVSKFEYSRDVFFI